MRPREADEQTVLDFQLTRLDGGLCLKEVLDCWLDDDVVLVTFLFCGLTAHFDLKLFLSTFF